MNILFLAALLLFPFPAFAGQGPPPNACPGSTALRQLELRLALPPASPWRTAEACLWDRAAVYAAAPASPAEVAGGEKKD